jgi:hypothetical protein
MNRSDISSQADYNPDHYAFRRQLPRDPVFVSHRFERIGGFVLCTVMTGIAGFIVLGLCFGWFR